MDARFVVVTSESLICYKKSDRKDLVQEFASARASCAFAAASPTPPRRALGGAAAKAIRRSQESGKGQGKGKGNGKVKGRGGAKAKVKALKDVDYALTVSSGDEYMLLSARDETEADLWFERLQERARRLMRIVLGHIPVPAAGFPSRRRPSGTTTTTSRRSTSRHSGGSRRCRRRPRRRPRRCSATARCGRGLCRMK